MKRKIIAMFITLLVFIGLFTNLETEAAAKPETPQITLSSTNDGTGIKITISKTKNTSGYQIYLKSSTDSKYKKVKTLKKDGTAQRTFTVTKLAKGKYSIKVRAYSKSGGKTVKGSYSKKSITLNGKSNSGSDSSSKYAKLKTGDTFTFGSYEQDNNLKNGKEPIEWQVLSNNGSELFAVSRYVLDCQPYNAILPSSGAASWEKSGLRKWLNNDFYNTAFNSEEKKKIKTTVVDNIDYNATYEKGNKTNDSVFILSVDDMFNTAYGFTDYYPHYDYIDGPDGVVSDEELNKLISRRAAATAYAIAKGCFDSPYNTYKTKSGEKAAFYWLRMTGDHQFGFSRMTPDGAGFYVETVMTEADGVRPAIVIKLK